MEDPWSGPAGPRPRFSERSGLFTAEDRTKAARGQGLRKYPGDSSCVRDGRGQPDRPMLPGACRPPVNASTNSIDRRGRISNVGLLNDAHRPVAKPVSVTGAVSANNWSAFTTPSRQNTSPELTNAVI